MTYTINLLDDLKHECQIEQISFALNYGEASNSYHIVLIDPCCRFNFVGKDRPLIFKAVIDGIERIKSVRNGDA